ncbi:MAG: VWA domain-containing protein [Sedimenticola thiotaurini]|uniref:VWA domain-containing protein n=1 Tax=Sedimenticola thiotaurini TaxID=1543721 RepID=A0A558D0J0_9GAMM|nr:MAG: VWA domain-containing protein [Sedimenticola thiotaurini]
MSIEEAKLQIYREQLTCNFQQLDLLFADCMEEAALSLSEAGIKEYLEGASLVCMIGRGFEPVLVYLEEMPQVAAKLGESVLGLVSQTVWKLSRTPNGVTILPFLQTLPEAARRLGSEKQLSRYIDLLMDMLERTSGSIHGFHATIPSPSAKEYLEQMPFLLNQLSLEGIRNWTEYGIHNYSTHPDRQRDYFSLQSADSRAILQRERHGTLFADNERQLELYLRALWQDKDQLVPYSHAFDELRKPMPYFDSLGIRLPDVFDDTDSGVSGINRYRAVLGHMAAHRRWSHFIFADNFSPFQRIAIELLEDSRVEYLAIQCYPGLRNLWLSLHPVPIEGECDPEKESCIRHRLAMLSYAILNPNHTYTNADILNCVAEFRELMQSGETTTQSIVQLAISFIARTRIQMDQAANVYFKNTVVEYRDDNRHLWKFIEEGDEEEQYEVERKKVEQEPLNALPPRHYPEWDYRTKTYRPDWVSLYESLHPPGDAKLIEDLLTKHSALAKRLKQILDLLKPQQYVRVRYQEDGSELDLDVAIRSLVDFKGGANPDPRINMSHRHDGRDIAVMLLLDLSESLHQVPEGCEQSILQLSQEAVALLAWAIDRLGDSFAIAGFSSNTRHEVRYQHIKGYSETWNDDVKARLAAMQAGYSTRMGAAIRHAGHYLGKRTAEKKLLLVLTDGEPSDIDVDDDRLLIEDARKAVQELDRDNIYTYCINLDPKADEYVADIFGKQYSVIDRVEKLPAKLPELFVSLTR